MASIYCDNSTDSNKQQINLVDIYNLNLAKGQSKIYSVTIKNLQKDDSLFIEIQSPYYDPYQIPFVVVKTDNFSLQCSQHNNEYVGICQIDYQNLKENKTFNIQVKCFEDCQLKLNAFLSQTFQAEFGHKLMISALKDKGTIQQFKIFVPKDANFTDIAIVAKITNLEQVQQGVSMYVSIGNQSTKVPTAQSYDYVARQVWGTGVGVFLNNKQIKAGSWIKVYIIVGQGVKVQFYTQSVNDNKYDIMLYTSYDDFTSDEQTKLYVLDLSDSSNDSQISDLSDETIQIIFIVYSGSPTIKVSFDEKFTNYIDNYDLQGTIGYLITPEIRTKFGFVDKIYISVTSFWTSNYYLYAYPMMNQYYQLSDAVSQLNQVSKSHLQNYLFESLVVVEPNETTIRSYRLNVQLISGNAQVGIRRCLSMEQNQTLDCLLQKVEDIQQQATKKSFDEINVTVRKEWSAYQLLFEYDAKNCQFYKSFASLNVYDCEFQIVVFPSQDNKQELLYAVTMYENRELGTLKESYIFKDFIYKQSYHYYDFDLPNIDDVEEVTFYLTVISGDVALMGTTKKDNRFMEISDGFDDSNNIKISFMNTLTFYKGDLATKFYVALFGYEASQVTISVLVKRKSSGNATDPNTPKNQTTEQSTLYLLQGLSQQYSLTKDHSTISFSFTPNSKDNYTIQIIEIEGDVDYVLKKNGSDDKVSCSNERLGGQQKCTFEAQANAQYFVYVNGTVENVETFSISYFSSDTCKKYPFNLPQFVYLASEQVECSVYSISDQSRSLMILSSFSTLDVLSTSVTFEVTFNKGHKITFTGREKQITSDQIQQFCKSDTIDNCNMEITLKGDQIYDVEFYYVVEQVGKEMVLFDGVVRKIVDKKLTQKKGKHFYYEVSSTVGSIKIFATNQDNLGYYIGAKLVDQLNFTASPDSLYLPYRNVSENVIEQSENIFQTRLNPKKATSVIQIDADQYKKYCTSCVLLISVYGLQVESQQVNAFELEVTQQESFIYLGESKTGFLSEDQFFIYKISANPNSETLLTIRDIIKQSSMQNDCFTADLIDEDTNQIYKIASGYAILKASSSSYKVIIESVVGGDDDICTIQVSFSSLKQSVSVLNQYMPSELKLTKSQSKYFIYQHLGNESFQILNYMKSGDLKVYANKIDDNISIQDLTNKNVDLFDFKSNPGDSFLYVHKNNTKMCHSCYYIIVIKGDPEAQSQISVVQGNQSIGLTTYGLLKQSLAKTEVQSYVFYSIVDFNVSVTVIYGELNVLIRSPDQKIVSNKSIILSTEFAVPRPASADNQYIDYYDDNSRFGVQVQASSDSVFYIGVKRKNINLRVYEGVPATLGLSPQNIIIQFININSEANISLLVEIKNEISDVFILSASAQVTKDGEAKSTKIDSPTIERSENSFNFIFKSIKGSYFITLSATQKAQASVILVKKKLTHLIASNVNLFAQPGAFEIYTPGQNVMIVIDSCQSQVEVKASDSYSAFMNEDTTGTSSVLLEHANYGGHYVITTENVQGEYFVEVSPKTPKDPMLYLISYYYFDKSEVMPYKQVDIVSEINYQLTADKIIFKLAPVRLLNSKSKPKISATYTLYVSNSSNASTMNSKCDSNSGYSQTQVVNGQSNQTVKFPIDFTTISAQVGEKSDIYFVSAKVKVKFEGQATTPNYPSYLDLAYSKTQITQSHHTIEFKSQTTSNLTFVIMWIVVPFILAAILFIFALKFCIKKYRQLYPDKLVEEDMEYGDSEGQMKQMDPAISQSLSNT